MLALTLALTACIGWGLADFLGGLKSRTLPVLTVLLISGLAGLGLIVIIVGIRGEAMPRDPRLLWAVAGGFLGLVSVALLYKGMAIGTMSIVAPISATGVVLPVVVGISCGDTLNYLQGFGMAAAISGVMLASREKAAGKKGKPVAAGVGLALSAAVSIGAFFTVVDFASEADPFWAALLVRVSGLLFLAPVLMVARPKMKVDQPNLTAMLWLGVVDTVATCSFTVATTKGMLSTVSVVGSLYPATTVILAALVLRERLRSRQMLGVALAICGVGMISVG